MLILAAVATVAVAAAVTPAEARWWGPPIFVAPPPVYVGPACHVRRERICDPWGCRVRRIEDCY
jgi:hypothetical protein